ncbi:ABC transporter permease [Levilactobacillus brevis]|uniref:ABC transporter permease n=2 Tax=Levilactobacillus brevis TaxID=1580 RepID=UPI000BE805CE|nr:ABC transporter permease [Levilactobacillus brevis]MCZ2119210.1 ABC transporter permease [Levilactobacillus brevis]MCZ2124650.1 ABC transporter permease [Levilactobacillus brevis]MCZ2208969.1 ABC transporter permease [Levilactobacillus brevis]MCZ2324482.1 ABC transporter permease [Levilactobacillus brevis]
MRTIAIMNRVLKELFRDKRTLALMFVAPTLIMLLMSVIFNTNSTTDVNVATVSVSSKLNEELGSLKHVTVKSYDTKADAKHALNQETVDAIVQKSGKNYDLTYANTDSSKTTAVKLAFKNALTATSISQLKLALKQSTTAVAKLQAQLALAQKAANGPTASVTNHANAVTPKTSQSNSAPKVTNHYVYGDQDTGYFAKMLPILMGFFVFFFVFLISGMALLKERTTGTLDRLLATPVKRSSIVFGYMLSYGILAILQTVLIVLVTVWLLGIEVVGSLVSVVLINLLLALVALAFGILLSTFANSEFQMMQFIPLVVVPQVFFSGIIPLDSMADWVKDISYMIPLKYSGDAVNEIIMRGTSIFSLGGDMAVLLGFLIVLTVLNIVGLRRYRKV